MNNFEQILKSDIYTLATLLQSKAISPVEVTERLLHYISEKNPENNAFITVMSDAALAEARKAEKDLLNGTIKSPLHGIPIGLKDLIFTKDVRTTMGSQLYRNYIPKQNADVVNRLQAAGAIIVGKQNTHEFAYGTTGDTSYFGPVKNPYDLSKVSGGSSSGSAVAVATDMCYASIGTDTGGSIRIPASFCNVVGMKPTYDLLDKAGVYPLAPTLDHLGIMTKTITDNAIMLDVLTNSSSKCLATLTLDELVERVKGKKIGIPTTFFYDDLSDEIADKMNYIMNVFAELGVNVVPVKLQGLTDTYEAHRTILAAESYYTHKDHLEIKGEKWESEVKERVFLGEKISACEYLNAIEIRKKSIYHFQQAFKSIDALLTPVTPIMPPKLFERVLQHHDRSEYVFSLLNKLTGISDVTGMPSLSVPAGFSENGMPIGFELSGNLMSEHLLYLFGRTFEEYHNQ